MTLQRANGGLRRKQAEKKLPEYMTAAEVAGIIQASHNPNARLLMLCMWRAGLRVSEALGLRTQDLSLDDEPPVLRVRRGKGRRQRIVPIHPELEQALRVAIQYGNLRGRMFDIGRSTAHNWIRSAANRAEELGVIEPGRKISSHVFRHSFARHALQNGVPINQLSLWLGHAHIQSTLIYLELTPDPTGQLRYVP